MELLAPLCGNILWIEVWLAPSLNVYNRYWHIEQKKRTPFARRSFLLLDVLLII